MMYLILKELANDADDVIMVTSSIMKDTSGADAIYRPNAIRALCRIIDVSNIGQNRELLADHSRLPLSKQSRD